MKIYVAGPLMNGHTAGPREAFANVKKAEEIYIALVAKGHSVYLPHFSYYAWIAANTDIPWERWMQNDYDWVEASDALFRIPGKSKGAEVEEAHALASDKKVFYNLNEVPEEPIKPINWKGGHTT